jgi:hypothetical protein
MSKKANKTKTVFTLSNPDSTRVSKPSVIRNIDGLGKSVQIWSRSILHPENEKYDKGDNKGEIKKVTQFAFDADFTDLIDWKHSEVCSIKMHELNDKGKRVSVQVRYLTDSFTEAQHNIIADMKTVYGLEQNLYAVLDACERMDKLTANPALNLVGRKQEAQAMIKMINSAMTSSQTAFLNKVNGIKGRKNKVDSLFDLSKVAAPVTE